MNNCLTRINMTQEKLLTNQDQTKKYFPEHFKNGYYKIIDNVEIAN